MADLCPGKRSRWKVGFFCWLDRGIEIVCVGYATREFLSLGGVLSTGESHQKPEGLDI